MNKISKIVVTILIAVVLLLPIQTTQAATIITVCASGCDHASIQAAINAATSGDTIQVSAGTYNENITINTNNITVSGVLALNPNDTPNALTHTIIDGGAPASASSPGITISNNVTGVTIQNLRVQNFTSNSGIYGALGNNGLTIQNVHVYRNNTAAAVNGGGIYMNGPVSNVLINNVDSQFNRNRGIVIWNGFKQNITITNNYIANNNCCGIELQDGTASGVTMTGNTVINNFDNGISAVGLMSGAGANLISNNTLTNNGRFGIEIKLPNGTGATSGDGSIVVENNTISLTTPPTDLRDFAGIAVFRRSYVVGNNNVDIPTGVVVRENTISGYTQSNGGSNSTGFGIVVEGTNVQVLNNMLTDNEVGVQVQAGHLPYTANLNVDGDQSNLSDDYFGRGNSPVACAKVEGNTYNTNGLDYRTVGSEASDEATIYNQTKGTYHCSIQKAIDLANSGDTIQVPAGSYAEDLTIDKAVTLLGPNSAINPNTGTRVAEAVLHPATSNPDPNVCAVLAYVTTSNVIIKGFTFDGDNPALTSGVMIGTADVDACELISSYEGVGGITIENNILENSTYTALEFYNYTNDAATSNNYIRYNLIRDIGETTYNWGIGVLVYNNFYADITDNVFDNVRVGIQTGNYYRANVGSTGSISNNTINTWRAGIFHNLWYSNASTIPVSGNTINAISSSGSTKWNGMLISSFQGTTNTAITNNIINIGTITQNPAAGYNIWSTPTTAALTISGGTVTGGNYGVWVNNFEGYNSNASNTSIIVDGVTVTNANTAGVYVLDSASNTNSAKVDAEIKNSIITNSATGILMSGSDANAVVNDNQIFGNTPVGITNTSGNIMNAENNWWGTNNGPEDSAGTIELPFTPEPAVVDMLNAAPAGELGNSVSDNVDYYPWDIYPTVVSIVRASTSPTSETSVDFTVTFSEDVTGVSNSTPFADFILLTSGVSGASITSVTPVSASVYTVSVNTGSGNGSIRLDVPLSASIKDLANNDLSGLPFTGGEAYTINKSPTFGDVPMNHPYWEDIEILYANGITAGCSTSPLLFCPEDTMNRAQSAVFILRGNFGIGYVPPNPPYTTLFTDSWARSPWAQKWAQGMLAEGLTAGCSTSPLLLFCPWEQMPRLQAAVFGMRLLNGNTYVPPAATGTVFADITDPNIWYAKWAEQAYLSGILPACGSSGGKPLFCPNDLVNRGLGAYMIVRAKNLTMP